MLGATSTKVVATMALLLALLVPDGVGAGPVQDGDLQEEQAEVRERQGEVALEVDALEAESAEVAAALETLDANVSEQEAELEEAERAVETAEDDLAAAAVAVADAEDRIAGLEEQIDELMVAAYMRPPAEADLLAFSGGNVSDVAVKRTLLDLSSHTNADLFDELSEAREDLELEREAQEEVAAAAEERRADAADELDELEAAVAEHRELAADAEEALELKLAEAAALEERDEELSEEIAAEQAELARQLEAAAARRAAEQAEAAEQDSSEPAPPGGSNGGGGSDGSGGPSPGTISAAPGGLATVSCPGGGAITVAGSLGPDLRGLLDAAGAAGVGLCGWGHRDPQRQVELRRQHCGTSDYAVYQMPSSQCSPPTARPGMSMHERGLAVDFTCDGGSISTRSSHCFRWLAANAGRYGLQNLPSEPWHWSTNGR